MADPDANPLSAGRVAAYAGTALALLLGAKGALAGARVFMRWVRIGRGFVRVCYAAATLQLLRRCPDCRRLIVREARVCRHCGWRRRRSR